MDLLQWDLFFVLSCKIKLNTASTTLWNWAIQSHFQQRGAAHNREGEKKKKFAHRKPCQDIMWRRRHFPFRPSQWTASLSHYISCHNPPGIHDELATIYSLAVTTKLLMRFKLCLGCRRIRTRASRTSCKSDRTYRPIPTRLLWSWPNTGVTSRCNKVQSDLLSTHEKRAVKGTQPWIKSSTAEWIFETLPWRREPLLHTDNTNLGFLFFLKIYIFDYYLREINIFTVKMSCVGGDIQ